MKMFKKNLYVSFLTSLFLKNSVALSFSVSPTNVTIHTLKALNNVVCNTNYLFTR